MENIKPLKADLEKYVDFDRATTAPKFFQAFSGGYGEGDQFLGVSVPDQRKVAKRFYKQVSKKEMATLLNDPIHEVRHTAIFMLVLRFQKSKEPKNWVDLYLKNLNRIDNWDLVDSSAYQILGEWLVDKPRDVLYQLAKEESIWKKRIAMVATMQFIRNDDYKDTFKLAEILLQHPHDLIQKAVGWMLKEIGKRNQEAEEVFLKKHYKKMPRTMLRYAIEKFPEDKRKAYLNGEI